MDYILSELFDGGIELTADETVPNIPLTPMVNPLYLHVYISSVSSGDTIIVKAEFENASNAVLQLSQTGTISAVGHYVLPLFCDHPDLTNMDVVFDTTANNTEALAINGKAWFSTSRVS